MRNQAFIVVFATLASLATGCERLNQALDQAYMQSFLESGQDGANEQQAAEAGGQPIDNDGTAGALILGCLTIITNPDPLPSPLSGTFTVTWQFNNCPMGGGRTQSGTRTVEVTIDGTTGDRDFAGSRDLTRIMFGGDIVTITSHATMHASGSRSAGAISRLINGSEHRVRTHDNGNPVFDIDVTVDNLHIDDTYDTGTQLLVQRVFNGAGAVDHNRINVRVEHTATDVTVVRAQCGCPISGSIHQMVFKDGTLKRERTYTFTSTCGEVTTDDGDTITLEVCG